MFEAKSLMYKSAKQNLKGQEGTFLYRKKIGILNSKLLFSTFEDECDSKVKSALRICNEEPHPLFKCERWSRETIENDMHMYPFHNIMTYTSNRTVCTHIS